MTRSMETAATKIITIRLTQNEFITLSQFAEHECMTRSAYIRHRLFGENVEPRKRMTRAVIKDEESASKILSMLGAARYANNLNQIAKAINHGVAMFSPEQEMLVGEACVAIGEMRDLLMQSLRKRKRRDQ